MDSDESDEECQLGRKDHWETCYALELHNFEDHGELGEIWFGKEVLDTMLTWMDELLMARCDNAKDLLILDLGTGNGIFPIRLAKLGYKNLAGCDYSQASIRLAEAIAQKTGTANIRWLQDDILDSRIEARYHVLTDKGTFDAVGLTANAVENKKKYKQSVWKMLQPDGLLIVTSCNSTAQELQDEFCNSEGSAKFGFVDSVKSYPVFHFGGRSGSKVCTLALIRISS